MVKDSIRLLDVYKQYLESTVSLISVVERHYVKNAGEVSEELRNKQKEFQTHAHKLIETMNTDLHSLLKINWELKALEETEEKETE